MSGNSYYEYASGKLKNTDAYQELINSYDKNGNIKSLKRQGKSFGSPITIDNLTYTYTGNQVIGIDDAITKNYDFDFFDNGQYYNISHTPEYVYDANGNLIQDLNKEIINISYNELNLPEIIDFKYNNRIEYQYDAMGNKKRQLVTEDGKLVKTIDFIGNFVYENDHPVYNTFDEGRIIYRSNGSYFAETYIKDHLGNIRVTYGNEVSGGEPPQYGIRQVNAYYPFGMNINNLSASKISKYERNEYLYNGKMFQDELGLDWLDYGSRFYDPTLGRWHSVDPRAEELNNLTPYNYCANNPIIANDPDGEFLNIVIGAVVGAVAEMTSQVVSTMVQGGSFKDAIKNMDWADVGVSTAQGALIGSGVGAGAAFAIEAGGAVLRSGVDITSEKGVEVAGFDKPLVEAGKDLLGEAVGMGTGKMIPFDKMASDAVADAFVKNGIKSGGQFVTGMLISDLSGGVVNGVTSGLVDGAYNRAFDAVLPEGSRARPILLTGISVTYDRKTKSILPGVTNKVHEHIRKHGYKSWFEKTKE